MAFSDFFQRAGKLAADNSPAILTAIGVTGVLTTAYLTGKASFKAAEIIARNERRPYQSEPENRLEVKEKVELVWKLYIPAATTGLVTVVCIIGANRIGTRRAAALATAMTISEKAFTEYKDKVVERLGQKKEQGVRDEIAQERVDQNPVSQTKEIIIAGGGDVLCLDAYTGRYFKSDIETLKKAQNDLNHRIISDMYASLTDFYNLIGLAPAGCSEEVGWSSDRLMELSLSTTLADNGQPCIVVDFQTMPIPDYQRFH